MIITPRREEGIDRELEAVKDLAGIFGLTASARAVAVTLGHADVIRRHQQLNIAFQTHDRELTDGNKQTVARIAQIQFFAAKALADRSRNRIDFAAAAAAIGRLYNLCFQQDGLDGFDHRSRIVGALHILIIRCIGRIARTKDARAAFAAEQDAALVVYCQTVEQTRAANRGVGLDRDAIEETNIDRVEATIIWTARFQLDTEAGNRSSR